MSGRLRLVTTRIFPAALAMGMAQHTIRGDERPFVPMSWKNEETRWRKSVNEYCNGSSDRFRKSAWAEGW